MIKKFNIEKTKQLNKVNRVLSFIYKKPESMFHQELDGVKNILVVDFALMGDMVMDIPFFKVLRSNCPNARITMVCMQWGKTILGDQGLVDDFIVFKGKDYLSSPGKAIRHIGEIRRALKRINQKKYDIGIEPKGDLRHTLFLRYTQCDRTISYNYTGGDYLVTDSLLPRVETKHLIDEKLDLLEMSGFRICERDTIPVLTLTNEWRAYARGFSDENDLLGKDIIGLHPGASNVNKQYRYYPDLIEKIECTLSSDSVFCVFEGPGEQVIVDRVVQRLDKLKRRYVRIKKSTKEYVSLVSICSIMICNDSAAGHIAAAYGIPTLVIFGAVMDETAIPRGRTRIEAVSHDLDCKPCTLPICPKGTEDCILSVSVDEVFQKYQILRSLNSI